VLLSTNKYIFYISSIVLLSAIFSYFFLDRSLALYFHNLHSSWVDPLFRKITKVGDSQYSLILSAIVFILLYQKNRLLSYQAFYIFGIVAVSGLLVDVIKIIVGRLRPDMLFDQGIYGFVGHHMGSEFNSMPSGHSATVFALCVGLTLLYPRYKYAFIVIAVTVGASRVILNYHYLSDVLVGSLLGGLFAYFAYQKYVLNNSLFNHSEIVYNGERCS
jgi:membrane-associated phospholipid phosphatase